MGPMDRILVVVVHEGDPIDLTVWSGGWQQTAVRELLDDSADGSTQVMSPVSLTILGIFASVFTTHSPTSSAMRISGRNFPANSR